MGLKFIVLGLAAYVASASSYGYSQYYYPPQPKVAPKKPEAPKYHAPQQPEISAKKPEAPKYHAPKEPKVSPKKPEAPQYKAPELSLIHI